MMNILGSVFTLFGRFYWVTVSVVLVWFVFNLLERLKNNDLNTYYNISSEDAAKNIKGKKERNSRDEINNNIQG